MSEPTTFKVPLSGSEANCLYTSLALRRNLIETGDPLVDAEGAVRKKLPFKPLSLHQKKLLIQIEELMDTCLKVQTATGFTGVNDAF